jgi:hypothetical protein
MVDGVADAAEMFAMVRDVDPDRAHGQASEGFDVAYALAAMALAKRKRGAFDSSEELLQRGVLLLSGVVGRRVYVTGEDQSLSARAGRQQGAAPRQVVREDERLSTPFELTLSGRVFSLNQGCVWASH